MKNLFSSSLFKPGNSNSLHAAVLSGDLQKVQQVVQSGVNVDAKDKEGSTPLQLAASRGFHGIVGELLDRQATLTVTDAVRSVCLVPFDTGIVGGNYH